MRVAPPDVNSSSFAVPSAVDTRKPFSRATISTSIVSGAAWIVWHTVRPFENDTVNVIGTSKGRGFAGFMKRHGFGGGRATHGSMFHRAPGSIGASAYPSRVIPGTRMAGHMGMAQVTIKNLQVVSVDAEQNLLLIRGAIPGPNGGVVIIKKVKR